MLSLPPSVRIFVAKDPVDGRKSFDGLAAIARDVLELDPLSGHLFVFFTRRRNRARILWWDHGGFWLLSRRLEAGQFVLPATLTAEGARITMTSAELMLILEGIDLRYARRSKRFSLQAS